MLKFVLIFAVLAPAALASGLAFAATGSLVAAMAASGATLFVTLWLLGTSD